VFDILKASLHPQAYCLEEFVLHTSATHTLAPSVQTPWLLSPNHLKEWDKCRKQFYYKTVLKQRWLSDERNFQLGKAVHALMDIDAKGMETQHLLQAQPPAIQEAFRLLRQHPSAQHPTLKSEWVFEFPCLNTDTFTPFPYIYVSGRVDRISQEPSTGKVWVIDWKTGTAVPPDYPNAWQTRLYLLAVWECRHVLGLNDLEPNQLGFRYVAVKPGKRTPVEVFDVPCDVAYLEETRQRLSQRVQDILAETRFPLPTSCPDRFCPYASVCGIQPLETEQLPLFSLPTAPVLNEPLPQDSTLRDAANT
jgi:RecB family exonuclease